jgi:glycyl-tRNA synthetase
LPWEKAHYSSQSFDQEVLLDRYGWTEVSGHAYRTDFDLSSHMKASGVDMRVYKEYASPTETEKQFVKPNMAKLGPAYKKEAGKVGELLSKADPEKVTAAMNKDGYYMAENYKVLPEQVQFVTQKVVERGKRFVPHVVEPSFGSDRLFYVALEYAYGVKDDRVIMSFPRSIAPIQIGVYPLMPKDGLDEKAKDILKQLTMAGFTAEYDEAGSIGRRYARADEAGIPLGITVDYDSLKNDSVTIRDRDSWRQVLVQISTLPELVNKYFIGKANFEELGTLVES